MNRLIAILILLSASLAQAVNLTSMDNAQTAQAKINAAGADPIIVQKGVKLGGSIMLRSNQTLKGEAGNSLEITTDNKSFAVHLQSGASGITIDGVAFKANCGVIVADGMISNTKIVNNDFVWAYNGSYYQRLAIRAVGGSNGLTIDKNNFLDSPLSDRTVDIFNDDNLSICDNTITNCNDAIGHVDGTHHHQKILRNVAKRCHRMGLEDQDQFSIGGDDIEIAYNVFTDWRSPDGMSFGLSIMPQRHTNVRVHDNYIDTGKIVNGVHTEEAPGGTSGHYGYGIEWGVGSGSCSNNTVIGKWVSSITCAMKAPVSGNKLYCNGKPQWDFISTEPGMNGQGTNGDDGTNLKDTNANHAPAPPGTITPPPATVKIDTSAPAPFAPNQKFKLVVIGGSSSPTAVEIDLEGDGNDALNRGAGNSTFDVTIPANATAAMTLKVLVDGVEQKRYAISATPPVGNGFHIVDTHTYDIDASGKVTNESSSTAATPR